MAIKMGSIVVDLTANTVSFSSAMSKASEIALSSSKNIQRSLGLISVAASTMAASVVASLTAATLSAQHYALEMSRFAEKTGTSVEMMSKLAFTAKNAGVPIDMLKGAMERLARTSGNAQGGQGQAIQAYEALGITVQELRGRLSDSGALLVEISKRLATMGESTRKNRIEQQLLGRTGSELNPMLIQMAYGFDDTSAAAEKFGIVIGEAGAAQAKKFNESMNALKSVMLGFEVRLLNGVSPALVEVAAKMESVLTSAKGLKNIDGIAATLSTGIRAAGSAFEFFGEHATAVKLILEGVAFTKVSSILLQMGISARKAGTDIGTIAGAITTVAARASGLNVILPLLSSGTTWAISYSSALAGLAATEGYVATASLAAADALAAVRTALASTAVVATGGILAALALMYEGMRANVDESAKLGDAATTWQDYWKAAIDNTVASLAAMKKVVTSFNMKGITAGIQEYKSIDNFGVKVHKVANARTAEQNTTKSSDGGSLKDAPILNTHLGAAPSDPVAKKLLDLRLAAEAAQKALADAGKGADFKRANDSAAEAKKTIEDLNLELARHGKHLTATQEAQIKSYIETRVNAESQTKFREELISTTKALLDQTAAMDVHTRSVGGSANQVRDAAIRQNADKQDADKDPEWLRLNQDLLKKRDEAFAKQYDASNVDQDASKLDDLRLQIALQTSLNAAIGKGRDAYEAAALSNEQSQIAAEFARRGDTDQQRLQTALETNKELFEVKKQQELLGKADGFDAARVYKDQAQELKDMLAAAREAGVAINEMQVAAARKDSLDAYLKTIDDVTLKTGTMKDGLHVFFEQMGRESTSAAQQMHDVLSSAFSDLNQNLVNLMTGQKANFADFFRGISSHLATLGLQKIESGLAGAIFGSDKNQKTGPEATNMWLEKIYGALTQNGEKGAGKDGGLADLLTDKLGDLVPKGAGSKVASVGKSLVGGLFGGHFALGGDVKAGMTYDVGEMGREKFTPTMDGKITPNKDLNSGGQTLHIDARGASDPAQTEAAVHRAMQTYGPAIAQAALGAASERSRRSPLSASR